MDIRHSPVALQADASRVIARPFTPGGVDRLQRIFARIASLNDGDAAAKWESVKASYAPRHKHFERMIARHLASVVEHVPVDELDEVHRKLFGAMVTMEYSLESVALFNPSMVPHPDQSALPAGCARFILSLRACGEGHISSIEFREGLVTADGEVQMGDVSPYALTELPLETRVIDKNVFYMKLLEMGAYEPLADQLLRRLPDKFTTAALNEQLQLSGNDFKVDSLAELKDMMIWLARSSYELVFPEDSTISERVIFPVTENESRGIEDARFVKFFEDEGAPVYYATYTAYNGFRTLPQLIVTRDFRHFGIHTLNGTCVQNKGMALFPRKINGRYVTLGRIDGENIYLMRTDHLYFWNESECIRTPVYPWEFVQVGNCGSPIELPEGWLVLTHGVGPMREYRIGALMLDLQDPSRVTAALENPLVVPQPELRDGYVPNVVYSCGGMIHDGNLTIPYAVADSSTRFLTVRTDDLLGEMKRV